MTEYTIRHYTDNGLVPSIKRNKNNNRLFDQESINWLTAAKYLRGCGTTVKAIKAYINLCLQGDSTINERYDIIIEQKKHWKSIFKKFLKDINLLKIKQNAIQILLTIAFRMTSIPVNDMNSIWH